MHQSFSDNRLKSHAAARTTVFSTTAHNADQMDTASTPSLEPRRLWASEQGGGDALLKLQNAILHNTDKTQDLRKPRPELKWNPPGQAIPKSTKVMSCNY